ncbi:MAG: hypothetical protein GY820_27000 [Gammaproteobacteria bacterium]|nr:hypothetical protein [Gammaproteobacteria bacterium]
MKSKSIIGFLMLTMVGVSYAGTVTLMDTNVVAVMSGYVHKGMFLTSSKDIPNPAECPNNNNEKGIIAAIPAYSEVSHVLSLALAAKAIQDKVDLHVYDDKCFEGWPVLRRIKVK